MCPMDPEPRQESAADSERSAARWALETACYLTLVYLSVKPDALERGISWVRETAGSESRELRRGWQVWRARREIRDLPETHAMDKPSD